MNTLPALLLALAIAAGTSLGGYFIGRGFTDARALERTVNVKGLSERDVPADVAIWPLQLSVADNLMLGRHRLTRTGFVSAGLRLPAARKERALHSERVAEIAAFVGLTAHLPVPVGLLPYGVQKRVELARALCMEPRLLLLDEPVAGMNGGERREMATLISAIREDLGISLLLVEHDMGMVMRLADAVTELDGIEGAQVHRSWWVARDAIVDAKRGDGRATLTLKDGAEVPVSRTYAGELREKGWI